jgi:ubiquinone/menaquinone biosynthesis C-methylase UbiE
LNLGSTVKVGSMDGPADATIDRPNHHAHHPPFRGLNGVIAALSMTFGRSAVARLAARLADVGPDDHVVDVGCGPGAAVRHAASLGATTTGVDPAAVMLRFARVLSFGRRRTRYVAGTAERLPLPDASATVVWSIATVHHWHDIDAGLAEITRVLADRGRFLAIERATQPGATGLASHGWTDDQAAALAARARDAGFIDVSVTKHEDGLRRPVLAVIAHTG